MVNVPKMQYLMVDGHGDPNKVIEYKEAVEALFSVSYTLKFRSKNLLSRDYVVPPLEGLWWSKDYEDFCLRRKDKWSWTMMIMVPDWLGKKEFKDAVNTVRSKKLVISVTGSDSKH